jgi:hypothetical protein
MYGAPVSAPRVLRPRIGYWIAAVLVVVAVACGVASGLSFSSLSRQVDSFQRVQVPGHGTATFSKPGGYLVYFEGPGFAGLSHTGAVRLSIHNDASGQQVSLSPLSGKQETYTIGGHSGQAVASFTITTPGQYVVNTGTPTNPAPADIALGPGIGSTLAVAIVGLVFGILALVGAVTLGIITAVLRSQRARRLRYTGPSGIPGTPYGEPGPQQPYPGVTPQQPYGQYPGPAPNDPQQPYGQHPGPAPNDPQQPAR